MPTPVRGHRSQACRGGIDRMQAPGGGKAAMTFPLLRMHIRVHTFRHTRPARPNVRALVNEWILCLFEVEVSGTVSFHAEGSHIGLYLSIPILNVLLHTAHCTLHERKVPNRSKKEVFLNAKASKIDPTLILKLFSGCTEGFAVLY